MVASSVQENGVIAGNIWASLVEFYVMLENGQCGSGTETLEELILNTGYSYKFAW